MRDPKRIDRMINKLRQVWHSSPDQRLGQLVCNLIAHDEKSNVYQIEDDKWESQLDNVLKGD
jgi:hypothetical protein